MGTGTLPKAPASDTLLCVGSQGGQCGAAERPNLWPGHIPSLQWLDVTDLDRYGRRFVWEVLIVS